jgi:hypothetical protein
MNNNEIIAIGHFLSTYYSDLIYIRDFQRFKNKKISTIEYLKKKPGSFYEFLIEFRVIRNVEKKKLEKLLFLTNQWVSNKLNTDVDKFAKQLKQENITHGKVMTSLASKILLLNNPWEILPIDSLVKKTFNLKTNNYIDYVPLIKKYISNKTSLISDYLEKISPFTKTIENEFKNEIRNIEMIRVNRFIDKMLWAEGKNI